MIYFSSETQHKTVKRTGWPASYRSKANSRVEKQAHTIPEHFHITKAWAKIVSAKSLKYRRRAQKSATRGLMEHIYRMRHGRTEWVRHVRRSRTQALNLHLIRQTQEIYSTAVFTSAALITGLRIPAMRTVWTEPWNLL